MAQKAENYKFEGLYSEYIPTASTDFASGDAVMVQRDTGYITTCLATGEGAQKFCGICDDTWNSTVAVYRYGAATDYTSPTTRPIKLKVYHRGVFDLAIRETTGYAGQAVWLQTSTSGSQIFTIDPLSSETCYGPIGFLYESFSGATANDCQKVRIEAAVGGHITPDVRYWLMNHPVFLGCTSQRPGNTVEAATASNMTAANYMIFMVGGIYHSIASQAEIGDSITNASDASMVLIAAMASDGSVYYFYDTTRAATDVASATLRASPSYWPSISLDYFPFAMNIVAATASGLGSIWTWHFRSYGDLFRVT